MSKQKKSGNTAKPVQEVKTVAGEKKTTGAKATLAGAESARINQRFDRITGTLMTIYVLFYLCIFPLATHDKYFDILKFRFQLYWIPTLIYGIIFLILGIFYLISYKRSNGGALTAKLRGNLKWNVMKTKLTKTDICFIALIFIMTLSVLFADYQYEALWGSRGRFNGLVLWLMFFIAYWLVTRFYHFKKWHLYTYLIAACLPEIWGITDFFLLDLFGFHEGADRMSIYTFCSSVGNINTYTNMVALHLGTSAALVVLAKDRYEVFVSSISFLIASFAIVMGISDNGLLAVTTIFAFLPFVGWNFCQNISRFFITLSTFLTSVVITSYLTTRRGTMASNTGSILITLGKTKAFLVLVAFLWIFSVIIGLILYRTQKKQEKHFVCCAIKMWALLLATGVAGILIAFIDANMGKHPEVWKPYQNALIFSDTWGNRRGMIWRFAWEFFSQKSNILKKLIGNGPDTFFIITMDYYKQAMKDAGEIVYDSVHNEYLEYLVTIGGIGIIAYMGTLVTSLQQMFKNPKNYYAIACGIAVLAYAVQAAVNIAIPITTPILMMLLYVGISITKETADGKTETEKTKKKSYEI